MQFTYLMGSGANTDTKTAFETVEVHPVASSMQQGHRVGESPFSEPRPYPRLNVVSSVSRARSWT